MCAIFQQTWEEKQTISYRKIKDIDISAFRKDISALPLASNYNDMDLADLCDAYDSQLRELFDRHAPLISRTASTKQRDPWDTEDVLDALRVKRRAERRFRK